MDNKLYGMTVKRLHCIADRLGIKDCETLKRNELVEAIEEALEEIGDERLQRNNEIMRLKGKLYDILDHICPPDDGTCSWVIPEAYHDTSIHLLLRDPFWAFAYWDVNQKELEIVREVHPDLQLKLRAYEFSQPRLPLSQCREYFDISVREHDNSWYINLNHTGCWYTVSLLAEEGEWQEILCSSNQVYSPLGYWTERVEELKRDKRHLELFKLGTSDANGHEVDSILVRSVLSQLEQK